MRLDFSKNRYATPTKRYADIGKTFSHIALITRALPDTRREVDDLGRECIDSVQTLVERNGTLKRDLPNSSLFPRVRVSS